MKIRNSQFTIICILLKIIKTGLSIMNYSGKTKKGDLIVEAALKLFAEKNFKEVSVSEIAEEAGVAVGTVYEHFINKEDLFFSIPMKSAEHFDCQLSLHLEGLYSPVEKIRKYIWFYLYYFQENPIIAEMLLLEARVNKRFFYTRHQEKRRLKNAALLLDLIKEGQAKGEVRDDVSPYSIRHIVLGALEHFCTYWVLSDRQFDVVSCNNEIASMVIPAIITQKEPEPPNGIHS